MGSTAAAATTTTTTSAPPVPGGGDGAGAGGNATPGTETPKTGAGASLLTDDPGAEPGAGGETGGEQGQGAAGDNGSQSAGELEIQVPEGASIDQAMLDSFKGVAKEAGLTSESASKLVAWQLEQQAVAEKAQAEAWEKQDKAWVEQVQKDAEIGGERLKASVVAAQRAMRRFGGEGLAKELAELGLGNHPGLVRAFAKIGLAMAEDNSGGNSNANTRGALSEDEKLARWYPNS